jgi:hypothetical protein
MPLIASANIIVCAEVGARVFQEEVLCDEI